MALISCPECGKQVSDRAKACPHCGFDLTAPKCPDCGAYLPADATACLSCGCPVETAPAAPVAAPAAAPAPARPSGAGEVTITCPGPHPSWKKDIPTMVVMNENGTASRGVIEWGKTITVPVYGPETLSIRNAKEKDIHRNEVVTDFVALAFAVVAFIAMLTSDDSFGRTMAGIAAFILGISGGASLFHILTFSPPKFPVVPGKSYVLFWNKSNPLEARLKD